mmetsp:Transcript_29592/g.41959  ORF Transcript_29592/g.41959 Transcript_29592/m.41959 type:complete len:218 (-) Transcript_29592:994-1647(-)
MLRRPVVSLVRRAACNRYAPFSTFKKGTKVSGADSRNKKDEVVDDGVTDEGSTITPPSNPITVPTPTPKLNTEETKSSTILEDVMKDEQLRLLQQQKDAVKEPILPPPVPSSFSVGQLHEFAPKIVVAGVGGAGGNALNNMIAKGLQGVDFLALNTDAQHLSTTLTDQRLQLGLELTRGLGCGANPDAGRMAAEECRSDIENVLKEAHMVFITAGKC